jgi:sugar phosphate isomerase/epimerase
MKYTRNEFLKLTGLGAAGSMAVISGSSFIKETKDNDFKFNLGLASYTTRNFSLDDTIKMMLRLGLTSVSLKDKHMPLNASAEDIKKVTDKVKSAGLNLYGAGVIYMKTVQEVENTFAYATKAGLEMIVGVPNHELLPLVNEKVISTNIRLAIHNHGPGDKLYTSPDNVYDKIKDLDKRIGLCIDIGHVQRIHQDPAEKIAKYKDRIFDMHMKDEISESEENTPVEIGRGIIDIAKVLKAIKKIKYKGIIAIEYEKDGNDPLPGLAESVGYLRAMFKMI